MIAAAVAAVLAMPESAQAHPKPKPKPPIKEGGNAKEDAKEGGKERPKIDVAKIKERLKAAFEKRKKNHKNAKKDGHKVGGKKGRKSGGAFGKLVRDDEKVKALREAFQAAAKEHHSKVKELHKQLNL